MAQQQDLKAEILAGLAERVTIPDPESGFCALRVKACGYRDLVTAVGHAAMISAGEWVTDPGEWVNDRTHGLQFRTRFLKTSAPSSIEGIEKHLRSGMIRDSGPIYARRMVRRFGKDPILTQHYAMLQRYLLYTGVTRGKRLVVLVGQPRAAAIAVKNTAGRRRWSKLAEWLDCTPRA